MSPFTELPYDRAKAVSYAHRWAFSRNPKYFNFDKFGGDCTNFASQCVYAGSGVMNFTPVYGWYYVNASKRTPSWTGVQYLYNFLTKNTGAGPYGTDAPISEVLPGDIIQLSFDGQSFAHSPVVVSVDGPPSVHTIRIAAHTYDSDNRLVSTYAFKAIRCIHILAVRR